MHHLDTVSAHQPAAPPRQGDKARICRLMETAAAAAFGVPVDEMRAPTRRSAEVALARQSAMYLAHVALGLNYSTVGTLFRRDRTTAAYACRMVEDRRDDPDLDERLQRLEGICAQIARGILSRPPVQP